MYYLYILWYHFDKILEDIGNKYYKNWLYYFLENSRKKEFRFKLFSKKFNLIAFK